MSLRRYWDGGKECVGRRTLKKCWNAHCNAAAHRPQPRTTRRWECVCACACAFAREMPAFVQTRVDRRSSPALDVAPSWLSLALTAGATMCFINEGFTDSPPLYQHNKILIHLLQDKFKEEKYRDCRVKGLNRARLLAPNVVGWRTKCPYKVVGRKGEDLDVRCMNLLIKVKQLRKFEVSKRRAVQMHLADARDLSDCIQTTYSLKGIFFLF